MSMAPPPGARRPAHLRRIACEAFERDDGLIELEGLLTDSIAALYGHFGMDRPAPALRDAA